MQSSFIVKIVLGQADRSAESDETLSLRGIILSEKSSILPPSSLQKCECKNDPVHKLDEISFVSFYWISSLIG